MEILNQYSIQVQTGEHFAFTWDAILILALGLICLIVGILQDRDTGIFMTYPIFYIMALVLFVITGIISFTQPVYKEITEYQISINETTTFDEVNDKYVIMSQDGKIYTVRDKDWESND